MFSINDSSILWTYIKFLFPNISGYRREFPADDYNHNNTPHQPSIAQDNGCTKNEASEGVTTIIENMGCVTPIISQPNGSISKDMDLKNQIGSTTKFSGNRSSRNRVSDESQQYSNLPINAGHHQAPLSVSVSASNSPFINKRMGSKQALLQVTIIVKLIYTSWIIKWILSDQGLQKRTIIHDQLFS